MHFNGQVFNSYLSNYGTITWISENSKKRESRIQTLLSSRYEIMNSQAVNSASKSWLGLMCLCKIRFTYKYECSTPCHSQKNNIFVPTFPKSTHLVTVSLYWFHTLITFLIAHVRWTSVEWVIITAVYSSVHGAIKI